VEEVREDLTRRILLVEAAIPAMKMRRNELEKMVLAEMDRKVVEDMVGMDLYNRIGARIEHYFATKDRLAEAQRQGLLLAMPRYVRCRMGRGVERLTDECRRSSTSCATTT
jgi:hypothetical protein